MIGTKRLTVFALVCVFICLLTLTACNTGKLDGQSELLGEPKKVDDVKRPDLTADGYRAFKDSVEQFAADFAAYAYDGNNADNFTVSPVSVYMALALSAECADGDTRSELLNALNVTREQLLEHFSDMYRSLETEHRTGDEVTGKLSLSNSIWVNKGTSVKQACISSLSNDYYAYLYSADFKYGNAEANKAVRSFVKQKTNGLIDKDFGLSRDTLCALINTLYLKTSWGAGDDGLPFTKNSYGFTSKDGSLTSVKLLQSGYESGRAVDFDEFTTFYARTNEGYKIKFLVPKDGYSIDRVFTARNISAANSVTDYGAFDGASNARQFTRVLFPEFKCKYDANIVSMLQDKFGVTSFFNDSCNFSALTDEPCYCSQIRHVTDLTVDQKGIEGAAVTMVSVDTEAVGPTKEYYDFVVDKAFGFVITDWQDITLFSGVVHNV